MADGGCRYALTAQKMSRNLKKQARRDACKTFALFDGKDLRHYVA